MNPFALPSAIFLVLANLSILYSYYFYGWNLGNILILYWAENLIVGFYNVLKMAYKARMTPDPIFGQDWSTVTFFIMHFGIFTFVHGTFVFGMVLGSFAGSKGSDTMFTVENIMHILTGFVILVISHGISYVSNFLLRQEWRYLTMNHLFFAPYSRIIVLHLAIIFGGFAAFTSNGAVGASILLIVFKTVVDLFLHLHEHSKISHLKSVHKFK